MTTVVFVHGTGVREPALTALTARVRDGLHRAAPHTHLVTCDWGTHHGATLAANGASIPNGPGAGAVPAPDGAAPGPLRDPGAGAEPGPMPAPGTAPTSGPPHGAGTTADDNRRPASGSTVADARRPGTGVTADGTRRPGPVAAADAHADAHAEADAAAWELLHVDPFAELRLAGAGGAPSGPVPPQQAPPDAAVRGRLAELLADPAGLDATLGLTAAPHGEQAVRTLLTASELTAAAEAADADTLAELTARALVALLLADAADTGDPLSPTATGRDAAVAVLAIRLGGRPPGSERGPARLLLRAVTPLASRAAVRRRAALTRATHPAAGDILRYLAHGDAHRTHLADLVRAQSGPVVLLCHSLGGIIAVDTLVTHALPQVTLLVTAGSQAPFLYETGALPSLRHPSPLPPSFPPWLNLHDPRDLLAFAAQPLFPAHATDVPLPSGQPFPHAHSAYWTNPALYEAVAGRLT